MTVNWRKTNYFAFLVNPQDHRKSHAAIELFIDDLHTERKTTVVQLLSFCGSEDVLWGIMRLLASDNQRVSGNAAYVLGTIAEDCNGRERLAALVTGSGFECERILSDFVHLLGVKDKETVMNAVGALGTLAESTVAREWMIGHHRFSDLIGGVAQLLTLNDVWASSNAALLFARLLISEQGAVKLLNHPQSEKIIGDLITSLGTDDAGRGMNAAFAIGRLCDMEAGITRLLSLPKCDAMITMLVRMLFAVNVSACKNACFALSCLAVNASGLMQLLKSRSCTDMIVALGTLLSSDDSEAAWFSAMTLKTFAKQPPGCRRLRDSEHILPILRSVERRPSISDELRDEVCRTLELLKPLDKPGQPTVNVIGPGRIEVKWQELTAKLDIPVSYKVFEGSRCVYEGTSHECIVDGLLPCTEYTIHIVAVTDLDRSPPSESTSVITGESVPGPPIHLQVVAASSRQLKLSWLPPEEPCGVLRGYHVYLGPDLVEQTSDLSVIISGLHPGTSYDISVCASTAMGKGERDFITATTTKLGMHAPAKPDVTVRGRCELHITWHPPVAPIGRTTRYDLSMDGDVIYSGVELYHTVRRLKPDTEYTFTVSVVTSEGRFESKPTKKRTAKDEFEVGRVPLYQPPRKVSETALLLEADSSKSLGREESTACQRSVEAGTETAKEVTEAMPSNKSPHMTRSNGAKLAKRRFAWEEKRRSRTRHQQEYVETFAILDNNLVKNAHYVDGQQLNPSNNRRTSVFAASNRQSTSAMPKRNVQRNLQLMSRSKSDVVKTPASSSSPSPLGQQSVRSRFSSNRLSSSFLPSRVNDPMVNQPKNTDVVNSMTAMSEPSIVRADANKEFVTQNRVAGDLSDENCSEATQLITTMSDDTDTSVLKNLGSRCVPKSSTTTVVSHQVLTFDHVAFAGRKPISTQRCNSIPLRLVSAKRSDDTVRRVVMEGRLSRTCDSSSKLSTQLISFPEDDTSCLDLQFRRMNTMPTSSFSRVGPQMWKQATIASVNSSKQMFRSTSYGFHKSSVDGAYS